MGLWMARFPDGTTCCLRSGRLPDPIIPLRYRIPALRWRIGGHICRRPCLPGISSETRAGLGKHACPTVSGPEL